jgi:hypothetical protein
MKMSEITIIEGGSMDTPASSIERDCYCQHATLLGWPPIDTIIRFDGHRVVLRGLRIDKVNTLTSGRALILEALDAYKGSERVRFVGAWEIRSRHAEGAAEYGRRCNQVYLRYCVAKGISVLDHDLPKELLQPYLMVNWPPELAISEILAPGSVKSGAYS